MRSAATFLAWPRHKEPSALETMWLRRASGCGSTPRANKRQPRVGLACRLVHTFGAVPKYPARRRAVSAIARVLRTIAAIRLTGPSLSLASRFWLTTVLRHG